MLPLAGRTAVVTGGSKGIGRAIALGLAADGASVSVSARDPEALASLQSEIEALGGRMLVVAGDATDPVAVQRVIDVTAQRFGGLDILINNVGGAIKFGDFLDLEDEDWRACFELNVMTAVSFVRCALPWLRKSASPRIINISSISGVEPGFYNPHYTITKAATINLSKYLANKLASEKILVNVVCPGPVRSASWDQNVGRRAESLGISFDAAAHQIDLAETAKIPLGRVGTGADVAALVAFLASDQAAWITGSCFHVDGGKLRSMS